MEIHIDNGDARVWMRQVFTNHTGSPQEGNYMFALPSGTTVSDFAVWDGPVRIPAVILERKRAKAIYQELKSQAIDPGLLEQGERTEDEARKSAVFSAHIVPIPAYGTKRLEIEYHEHISVSALKSYFLLPLKPDAYAGQTVQKLSIHFELRSAGRMTDFAFQGKLLPFHIDQQDEHNDSWPRSKHPTSIWQKTFRGLEGKRAGKCAGSDRLPRSCIQRCSLSEELAGAGSSKPISEPRNRRNKKQPANAASGAWIF